jgi:hypothetical protein
MIARLTVLERKEESRAGEDKTVIPRLKKRAEGLPVADHVTQAALPRCPKFHAANVAPSGLRDLILRL